MTDKSMSRAIKTHSAISAPIWHGKVRVAVRSKFVAFALAQSLCFSLGCSYHVSEEPKTITFVDPEWSHDLTERNVLPDQRLQEFTRQTGINVKHLPTPEPALDQLAMTRQLLKEGSSTPDVLGVDVIWPGILLQNLIDLKPYLGAELSLLNPEVVASYTVQGKLVAVPFHSDLGVLFYRKDLLREYGYANPPDTWDQLEKIADRIQRGERAKGHKDFWGFVWPGAAGEGLTCNALEWQIAEGGGRIIEGDGTISVNNPNAIRSWERAARWVGSISSPNVPSYQEWDAVNTFYSGRAAFFRGWARSYFLSVEAEANPEMRDPTKISSLKIGITRVPGAKGGRGATLGGFGLGIAASTLHPEEALKLVRFLLDHEIQTEQANSRPPSSQQREFLAAPTILKVGLATPLGERSGVFNRPSNLVGSKYDEVDRAYIQAVHSVLTGKAGAPEAAKELEKQIADFTDAKAGPQSGNVEPPR